ncbi:ABC transporter permease [Bailinhaonella thermotolerans]|uniref:Transport permease protein n=1 Tax=Bailinhaonella thermotolerans TaxID=1070861 RepID=A0A3A3ZYG4_9ACTN|nr:ABC transporter permease [Bailinhaonella thermotolerans]RJL20385.1 ABC transporter permease [Bailinhaonella thermotolerans]
MTGHAHPATAAPAAAIPPVRFARETGAVARRVVRRSLAVPAYIIGGLAMPVVFTLLFGYVFGSAIPVPGGDYIAYLMPGILVQSRVFGLGGTAAGVAEDSGGGLMDRYRSLPMSRTAILAGRTIGDQIAMIPGMAAMIACALLAGWRVSGGPLEVLAGFGLLLLLGYALSWAGVYLGLVARDAQATQFFVMLVTFPLTFVANTFVPTQGMPGWLRTAAEWNPLSAVTTACRLFWGNPAPLAPDAPWPLQNPVAASLAWIAVVLLIFVPLSARRLSGRLYVRG